MFYELSRQKPTKNFIEHWEGDNKKAIFEYKSIEHIVGLVPECIKKILTTLTTTEQSEKTEN